VTEPVSTSANVGRKAPRGGPARYRGIEITSFRGVDYGKSHFFSPRGLKIVDYWVLVSITRTRLSRIPPCSGDAIVMMVPIFNLSSNRLYYQSPAGVVVASCIPCRSLATRRSDNTRQLRVRMVTGQSASKVACVTRCDSERLEMSLGAKNENPRLKLRRCILPPRDLTNH
jgi:hypothetical protein